jgi:hypothetical protein
VTIESVEMVFSDLRVHLFVYCMSTFGFVKLVVHCVPATGDWPKAIEASRRLTEPLQ